MIFDSQHLGDKVSFRESARNWNCRREMRCYFSTSVSATQQIANNKQTTVQAGGSASVTGAENSGNSNVSGTAVNGSNNNISITTADPAIVNSALESNSLVATEALSTYDHLVTGQTSGQLQALADTVQGIQDTQSQAAEGTGGNLPINAIDTIPENPTSPATAQNYLPAIFIAGAAVAVIYLLYKK